MFPCPAGWLPPSKDALHDGSRYDRLKAAQRSKDWLERSEAEINGLISGLETDVKDGVQRGIKGPLNPEDVLAEHRRNHRTGTPSKIATDAEVQAFSIARLDTETLKQIVAAVAASFPPERHISLSGLSRWWTANKKSLSADHRLLAVPR